MIRQALLGDSRMRRGLRRTTATSLLVLLSVGPAAADDFYPPQQSPHSSLAPFGSLLGTWHCDGVLAAGAIVPGAPAAKYHASMRIESLYGGFAYSVAYEQTFEDKNAMVFRGTWFISWDDVHKKLAYFWVDNMGTLGQGGSPGWDGTQLVMSGDGSVPEPGKDGHVESRHAALRDTFSHDSMHTLHWKGEIRPDGAPGWIVVGDDHCTSE